MHLDWCCEHNIYICSLYDVPCVAACTTNKFFLEFSLIALQVQNVFTVIVERREQVPFSMAIENGELMHECCAWEQHLRNTCAWEQHLRNTCAWEQHLRNT